VRRALLAACALSLALCPAVRAAGPGGALDSRAWEMVSPVQKNGGEVAPYGEGAMAAASQGGAVAFASEASFGEALGASPLSQYLASRGAEAWSTQNLTPAVLSGTYAFPNDPDPYLLFSNDLKRALLSGGWACRDGGEACEAEAPPLGAGGPSGYRNIYRREGSTYTPLVTEANFPALPPEAGEFHLRLEGASPDLAHVVFASSGQLYEWSEGGTVTAIGSPGASLAASGNQRGAVSEGGARVYSTEAGTLYLREGKAAKTVAAGASFGAASTDGATAYYTASEQLHSYDAAKGASSAILATGVKAFLGASPDGAYAFYVTAAGIYRLHGGVATKIVADVNASHLPPATGPSAVAASGSRLFFTAADPLLPSRDSNGQPDAYEWEAQGTGSCESSPGCLGLLSSGRSGSAAFATASASGDDAYLLTVSSLLPADTGALDLYDARSGGGFAEAEPEIECEGDDCQGPPYVPQDPAPPTSVVQGPANPPLSFPTARCPKGTRATKHGCVERKHKKHRKYKRHRRRSER
jgi:hypothetical protein